MTSKSQPTVLEQAAAGAKRLRILAGERALAEKDPVAFLKEHFDTEVRAKLANMSPEAVAILVSQRSCTEAEAKDAARVREARK